MALKAGYSSEVIGKNIAMEVKRGTPHEQAIAIALNMARKEWRKYHPVGAFPHHLKGAGKFYQENPSTRRSERFKNFADWRQSAKNAGYTVRGPFPGTDEYGAYDSAGYKQGEWNVVPNFGVVYWYTKKNPISEKTVHKLRKAAPGTFAKMTDEEIKKAVKVTKKRDYYMRKGSKKKYKTRKAARKNPVRPLSRQYFVEVSQNKKNWSRAAIFVKKESAIEYARALSKKYPFQYYRVRT